MFAIHIICVLRSITIENITLRSWLVSVIPPSANLYLADLRAITARIWQAVQNPDQSKAQGGIDARNIRS